ncbi:MAG TPA: RodZ domain-containing protein [Steroidobacteraceae bacterium]|jgi:cytoskeleton protein RodZ|nr:RodZ domain-containing protein [Steroidobacteraceae bacterium]
MSDALDIGRRLEAARVARGLSVSKAADDLHLDAWVVEALEADEHARVGPEVFIKGHLRRYADLLGLPAADILAAYEARPPSRKDGLAPAPAQPHDVKAAVGLAWPSIGAVAALLVIGVGTNWVKPWRTPGSGAAGSTHAANHGEAASGGALVSPALVAAQASTAPPVAPAASGTGIHPRTSAAGAPAAARPPVPAVKALQLAPPSPAAAHPSALAAKSLPPPPPFAAAALVVPAGDSLDAVQGAGHARLRLSFSADSWVDVHDAAGRRVFAGNGRANSVRTLSGAAPMHVYLRYASGVQLEINDRAVAIGRQFMAGDVARFEAGADGVLRRELRAADAPAVAQSRDERPSG